MTQSGDGKRREYEKSITDAALKTSNGRNGGIKSLKNNIKCLICRSDVRSVKHNIVGHQLDLIHRSCYIPLEGSIFIFCSIYISREVHRSCQLDAKQLKM